MRKDVKVGLVLSLVVVVVAGLYYVGRNNNAEPVKLEETISLADKAAGAKGPVVEMKDNRLKTGANKTSAAGKPLIPPSNPRINPKPPPAGSLTPPPETATAKTDQPRTEVKPDIATGTKPDPASRDLATAKDAVREPLPGSASPEPFNNLFQFGKNSSDSASAATDALSEPKGAPGPVAPDAKRRPGMDGKPETPIAGGSKSEPPAQPGTPKTADSGEPVRTHKIERGDTYAVLAEHYYGSQKYAQFLMDSNPQYADPMKLREGIVLKVPPRPAESPAAAKNTPPASTAGEAKTTAAPATGNQRTYTVKEDDTLYGIASRELGKGSRWPELLDLNKAVLKGSPERLRVGQALKLPTPEKPADKKP